MTWRAIVERRGNGFKNVHHIHACGTSERRTVLNPIVHGDTRFFLSEVKMCSLINDPMTQTKHSPCLDICIVHVKLGVSGNYLEATN